MAKIDYEDKVALQDKPAVAEKNKVTADDMNEIKTVVNNILTILGLSVDTYSTSTSYAVDDLVIYDNTIYSCNTATSGAWDSSKWDLVQNLDPSTMQINSKLTKNLVKQSELDELTTYSTEEKVVGTWIDGKPIYEKTFTGTLATVHSAITKTNLNYDTVIEGHGWIYSIYENWWQIGGGSTTNYGTSFAVANDNAQIFTGSYFNNSSQTILTMQYTKTTD